MQLHSLKHKTLLLLDKKSWKRLYKPFYIVSEHFCYTILNDVKHMFHKTFTVICNIWSGIGFRFNNSETKQKNDLKSLLRKFPIPCFQFFMLL